MQDHAKEYQTILTDLNSANFHLIYNLLKSDDHSYSYPFVNFNKDGENINGGKINSKAKEDKINIIDIEGKKKEIDIEVGKESQIVDKKLKPIFKTKVLYL